MNGLKNGIRKAYRAWMRLAHGIGRINTAILLSLLYFTLFGIARLATFLLRKDLLDTAWRDRSCYWSLRRDFRIDRDEFLRPF